METEENERSFSSSAANVAAAWRSGWPAHHRRACRGAQSPAPRLARKSTLLILRGSYVKRMNSRPVPFLVLISVVACCQTASAADQTAVNQLIIVIERSCLAGHEVQISADVMGNFILKKKEDHGPQTFNIRTSNGGVGYLNEQLRLKFDEATRDCMKPYIDKLIAVILEQPLPGSIQKLDWISSGQSIAQVQLALKNRDIQWSSLSDGRQS